MLNVAPEDKKTRTMGWVELSPKCILLDVIDKKVKDEKRTMVHSKSGGFDVPGVIYE